MTVTCGDVALILKNKRMRRRAPFFILVLAVFSLAGSLSFAQSIPYAPSRYSWGVDDGEIQLVVAKYSNRNSFNERAYTFYFTPSGKKELQIIPVSGDKPGELSLTLTSASGGDWIFSDLAVQRQGNSLYLIKVRQSAKDGWAEPGDLMVERFLLKKGDDEDFPYQFVPLSKIVSPAMPRISVDEELKRQVKSVRR